MQHAKTEAHISLPWKYNVVAHAIVSMRVPLCIPVVCAYATQDFMNGGGGVTAAVKSPSVGQLVPVDFDNCERSSGDQRAK